MTHFPDNFDFGDILDGLYDAYIREWYTFPDRSISIPFLGGWGYQIRAQFQSEIARWSDPVYFPHLEYGVTSLRQSPLWLSPQAGDSLLYIPRHVPAKQPGMRGNNFLYMPGYTCPRFVPAMSRDPQGREYNW